MLTPFILPHYTPQVEVSSRIFRSEYSSYKHGERLDYGFPEKLSTPNSILLSQGLCFCHGAIQYLYNLSQYYGAVRYFL